jgi:glutamate formiminotransferase/formiminotetrahydrofolate cyclodeaminase
MIAFDTIRCSEHAYLISIEGSEENSQTMQQIVECVPNFSDGRRPEVYNSIADAIRSVSGLQVLDVSADFDHNRTVITFVGNPSTVEEGAYRAIEKASQLINLDEHEGEHPRIGATDVCPFIPVKGVTMEECVDIAHRLGQRVGEELEIAVYFYGSAAKSPERKKLSNIRRGQYEQWREEIGIDPSREPDYGSAIPNIWGATVIGVRPFLIAYNIYLNTDDVKAADQIARAVRFSSGGLRHIQAMSFLVEGQAQVSMNLTDFTKTPIFRVQELVRREAARYGYAITKAELVGMAPEKAFLEAAKWYLQLDDLSDNQILELRIADGTEADIIPEGFLEAVASNTPTPGGGSVAALAGTLGAALTQMVANLTIGRKKYTEVDAESQELLVAAGKLRKQLTNAINEDAEAFERLMDAWKNKHLSEDVKKAAVEKAAIRAGEVPLEVARLSKSVSELAKRITAIGNSNAVTDSAAAAIMAHSAVKIAGLNVKVNALGLEDQKLAASWKQEIADIEAESGTIANDATALAAERGGF